MKRLFKFCLGLCMFLCFTFVCFSQGFYQPGYPPGTSPQQIIKQQEKSIKLLKYENPKFAESEERLLAINREIEEIVKDCQERKVSRKSAREKLRPLVREIIEITTNPDYLVEQRTEMLLPRQ